jgi:flagellar basal-body rod protein FlgG
MLRALFSAATGMEAQALRIDVIANNLANVNTNGFKTTRAEFQDLMSQTIKEAGASSSSNTEIPTGLQVGLGTRPAATHKIFTQGDFQLTSNELDLAIEGKGFFQILQPNGDLAYSKAGSFSQDSQGRIVTADGYPLQPEITIPDDTLSITIGSDELATFPNQAGLKAIGRNLFTPTTASGDPITGTPGEDGLGTLAQGYIEMSNVNIVQEMVDMIMGQRAYELNSQAVKTADEMLQIGTNIVR